jgi:hypothetical protein
MAENKEFEELSEEELIRLAKDCVRKSSSKEEIKKNLNEAGFNGDSAAISSTGSGLLFQAMIMVWGPNGKVINA